jgi:peptide chain release factor subunit 3
MLHIHTAAEIATIKDILVSYEKNDKGEVTEKQKPRIVKSFTKIICRIETRIPIALETSEKIPQLSRFTLRDEGHTIAVGKVMKYKPASGSASSSGPANKEETKSDGIPV